MKMKNVFMLLLGAMLVLSMIGTGTAANAGEQTPITEDFLGSAATGSTKGTTNVTLVLSQSFEVILPADFQLTENGNGEFTGLANVSAYAMLLSSGNKLTVSMTSATNQDGNTWHLTNTTGSDTLDYATKVSAFIDGGHVDLDYSPDWYIAGTPIIHIDRSGVKQDRHIHFKLINTPTVIGKYKDTLTFNIYVGPTP